MVDGIGIAKILAQQNNAEQCGQMSAEKLRDGFCREKSSYSS